MLVLNQNLTGGAFFSNCIFNMISSRQYRLLEKTFQVNHRWLEREHFDMAYFQCWYLSRILGLAFLVGHSLRGHLTPKRSILLSQINFLRLFIIYAIKLQLKMSTRVQHEFINGDHFNGLVLNADDKYLRRVKSCNAKFNKSSVAS